MTLNLTDEQRLRGTHEALALFSAVLVIVAGCAVPAVLFLMPLTMLWLFRGRLNRGWTSPVRVATYVITGAGFGGYLIYGLHPGLGQAGASLATEAADVNPTIRLLVIAASCLVVGASLTSGRAHAETLLKAVEVSRSARSWMLFACFLPLLLALRGYHTLMDRETYLYGSAGSLTNTATSQLGFAAVALLGYLFVAERGGRRFFSVVLTIGYAVLFFGTGSRRMALLPIVFALGGYAASMTRKSAIWLLIAALVALWLSPLPLFLRGLPEHGVVPYWHALGAYRHSGIGVRWSINNILFSYPVISTTAFQESHIPLHNIWVEMNPLPGTHTGWYQISASMRINDFVPFSGIGELGQQGMTFFASFWLVIGLVFGYLERRVRRLLNAGLQVPALAILGLTSIFAVIVTQYNLRSASRMLYYAIAIDLLVRAFSARANARASRRVRARPMARPQAAGSASLVSAEATQSAIAF